MEQREQRRLAAAGLADQADALAGLQAQAEALEDLFAARIAEGDIVERDRGAALHQRLGLGVVAQFMRHQQRGDRLGQPGNVLGDVDQRHREIARRIQNGETESADQHDVAGGRPAILPEHDRPGHQGDREHDSDAGMDKPQLLQIAQAAAARGEFPVHSRVEPLMLVPDAAEGTHQRHVADNVDHLAVDDGGLVGEVVMQRFPCGSEAEHRKHHAAGNHHQAECHVRADGSNQRDCRNRCDARRQHIPDEHVLDREHRIRRRRDAARQHAGHAVGEVARRVAGKMTKDVTAQVTRDTDEGEAGRPARDPPKEIVGGDQRHEENECQPYVPTMRSAGRQAVDEGFDAVLRAYGAGNGRHHSRQDHEMRREPTPKIAQNKGKRPVRIPRKMIHVTIDPVVMIQTFIVSRLNIDTSPRFPGTLITTCGCGRSAMM
ncbi:hypothetical protein ACVWZK_007408 [Bradyrhizobium sp. GM0.4]